MTLTQKSLSPAHRPHPRILMHGRTRVRIKEVRIKPRQIKHCMQRQPFLTTARHVTWRPPPRIQLHWHPRSAYLGVFIATYRGAFMRQLLQGENKRVAREKKVSKQPESILNGRVGQSVWKPRQSHLRNCSSMLVSPAPPPLPPLPNKIASRVMFHSAC